MFYVCVCVSSLRSYPLRPPFPLPFSSPRLTCAPSIIVVLFTQLECVEAQGLASADGVFEGGKSDPYCKVDTCRRRRMSPMPHIFARTFFVVFTCIESGWNAVATPPPFPPYSGLVERPPAAQDKVYKKYAKPPVGKAGQEDEVPNLPSLRGSRLYRTVSISVTS